MQDLLFLDLAEMDAILLAKIEELTLHVIKLNNELISIKKSNFILNN